MAYGEELVTVRSGGDAAGLEVAELLVGLARIDTLLGDLYLAGAAARLALVLDEPAERHLRRDQADAEALPDRLEAAVAAEDWGRVRETSARLSAARRRLEGSKRALAVAEALRRPGGPALDPLSPGLRGVTGAAGQPEALRRRGLELLDRLARLDPGAAPFYRARRAALAGRLAGAEPAAAAPGQAPAAEARKAEALAALQRGDLQALEALSARLAREGSAGLSGGGAAGAAPSTAGRAPPAPLTCAFAPGVLERAAALGLSPVHLPSAHERVADLYALAWRPPQPDDEAAAAGEPERLRLPVPFPADAPPPLRELLTLYMRLPFVNAGGGRDLPSLAEEDALVELFDDPAPGASPTSPLLGALGLPGRCGLSRVRVERALQARGVAVVEGLGLDPAAFRLVCLPCDLHVRIGRGRGWGRQPIWTHLDGHMITPDRRFLALAGGDVRYGGIYDLVGVGREYDAERLVVRFAVVMRRRFMGE